MARKYANLFRVVEIDSEKLKKNSGIAGEAIFDKPGGTKEYLADTSSFFRQQEEEGSTVAVFDWQQIKESSYAGKGVNLNDIELQTLRSIAFHLDIPLDLLMYSQVVNRSVMEVLSDIFVSKRKSGARNHIYTPIIEGVANELLLMNDIDDGRLVVEYNPFLSKNLLEAAQIISSVWNTGSITPNEVRAKMDLPPLSDDKTGKTEDIEIYIKNQIVELSQIIDTTLNALESNELDYLTNVIRKNTLDINLRSTETLEMLQKKADKG